MKITHQVNASDPVHPIMHGDMPFAKEFNKRQKRLWKDGATSKVDFEQIATVILEILIDDYNRRHASRKRGKKLKNSEAEE